MGTKTISLTEEAYERLKAHRREGESFTDAVLRLTAERGDPLDSLGAMAEVEGFREAVEGARDDLDGDLRERRDRRGT